MQLHPEYHFRIIAALTGFGDECCGKLTRLIACESAIVLIGVLPARLGEIRRRLP
jgi:hypothetical protein